MTTYTDAQGMEHELPKLTLALARRMELGDRRGEARWRAMLDFVAEVLPPEELERQLDGRRLDDVDLAALERTYSAIEAAYRGASIDSALALLDRLDLDRLAKVADTMGRLDRQGFKRVV